MSQYIKSHDNYIHQKKHQDTSKSVTEYNKINSVYTIKRINTDGSIYERDWTTINGVNQFSPGQIPIYRSSNFIITTNLNNNSTKPYIKLDWEKNGSSDIWDLSNLPNYTLDKDEIILNQDYYSLKDFAYFGSCSELIRASINDIINHFPGELYVPNELIPVYYTNNAKNLYPNASNNKVNNDLSKEDKIDRLGGNDYYLVDNPFGINIYTKELGECENFNRLRYFCNHGYENYTINGQNVSSWSVTTIDDCVAPGNHLASVDINSFTVEVYVGDNNEIIYLTKSGNGGTSVRPKKEIIDDYFDHLDSFQSVLLNRYSNPKYTALFEIYTENSYGYSTELKSFTFPLTYGGYNLAINNVAYSIYIDSLLEDSSFYDSIFTDNLYRAMTHDSIKNFDWTYTREYDKEDEKEFIHGGERIKKALRLFAREFDEIKYYIDGIKTFYNLTYSDINSMPDYFLKANVSADGWDIKDVYIGDSSTKTSPFHTDEYTSQFKDGGECRNDTYIYGSDKEFTYKDINDHFMKVLRLNSRNIFRQKGTVLAIETVLALFGLKSKRWVDSYSNSDRNLDYDYEINEYYAQISSPIIDTWDNKHKMFKYDFINFTKNIIYDTEDYRNGVYKSYQGLPVKWKEVSTNERVLYPFFDNDLTFDGKPYYQMNGGWEALKDSSGRYFQYDNNGKRVYDDDPLYTNTFRNIRVVNSVSDLVSLNYDSLRDNDIYQVNNIGSNYAVIDGVLYPIKDGYIKVYMFNNCVKVGNASFYDEITVSDDREDSKLKHYDFSEMYSNSEIMIYCGNQEEDVKAFNPFESISNVSFLEETKNETQYFKLINRDNKQFIGGNGWVKLEKIDNDYNKINTLIDYYDGNNPHYGNNSDSGYEYLSYFSNLFKYAYGHNKFEKRYYDNNEEYLQETKKAYENFGFKGLANDDECSVIKKYGSDKIVAYNEPIDNTSIDEVVNIKNFEIIFKTKSEEEQDYIAKVMMHYVNQVIPATSNMEIIFS